jgi:superoxide dismutase, Fe-Mn family
LESGAEFRKLVSIMEAADKLELVKLPVAQADLDPVLSEQNIKYHYGVLARGYVDRFNAGEGDPEFNQAGAYLHNVLFSQFQKPSSGNKPTGPVAVLIDEKFGSYSDFQEAFALEAMKIQGSGWIYLSRSGTIRTIPNHKIRRDILLLVDWWEHAFYIGYGPDKKKYLKNIWRIIDWNVINSRL